MNKLIEIFKFLLAGGAGALTNLVMRYLLSFVLPFEAATVLAYITGMPVSFLLMRHKVFVASGRRAHHEFMRFATVTGISFCIVVGLSTLMYRVILPMLGITWHAAEIAHLTGVIVAAVNSYIGHKHFSFAQQKV